MGIKTVLQTLLMACLLVMPAVVSAQDILVCPQIFPECDKDGNVATSFAQVGEPCFAYYQAQCYAARIQELESQLSQCQQAASQCQNSISQCQETSSLQEQTVLKFKRKLRRMRRSHRK